MSDIQDDKGRTEEEVQAFQEAWLNRHGLTRFVRFVTLAIVIFLASFFSTTLFVQGKNRDDCENGKPLLINFYRQQKGAVKRQQDVMDATLNHKSDKFKNAKDARDQAQNLVDILGPASKQDCVDRYPIVPVVD